MPLTMQEVSSYVAALKSRADADTRGVPSACVCCGKSMVLLATGRGNNKSPGEFRRSQNWLGGIVPAMPSLCRRHRNG